MKELLKQLKNLSCKREALIKTHFGENLRTLLAFPNEQKWYFKYILPIDKKMIGIAKTISPNDIFDTISDVYSNEYIKNLVNSHNYTNVNDHQK